MVCRWQLRKKKRLLRAQTLMHLVVVCCFLISTKYFLNWLWEARKFEPSRRWQFGSHKKEPRLGMNDAKWTILVWNYYYCLTISFSDINSQFWDVLRRASAQDRFATRIQILFCILIIVSSGAQEQTLNLEFQRNAGCFVRTSEFEVGWGGARKIKGPVKCLLSKFLISMSQINWELIFLKRRKQQ